MKTLNLVVILLSLLTFAQVWAIQFSNPALQAEDFSIEEDQLHLKAYRFLNKNGQPNSGQPVVLAHGFASNFHMFEGLIPFLVENNFDVYAFNFRGHGQGDERSTVSNYQEGDYRFEHLMETDLPAVVRRVYELRREKVLVAGHSMGGMISLSSEAKGYLKNWVSGIVTFGSPPNVDYQKWDPIYMSLRSLEHPFLYAGSGEEIFDPQKVLASYKRTNFDPALNALRLLNTFNPAFHFFEERVRLHIERIHEMMMSGILITENLSQPEDNFIKLAFSHSNKDIHRSMAEFAVDGFPYGKLKNSVPRFNVIATKDGLARPQDIKAGIKIQASEKGYWQVELPEMSHVDMLSVKAVRSYFGFLKAFTVSPQSLGAPNQDPREVMVDFLTSRAMAYCTAVFVK